MIGQDVARRGTASERPSPNVSLLARRSVRTAIQRAAIYALVTAGAFVLLVPLVWLLSSSLKPTGRIFVFPPEWIPNPVEWRNYTRVWEAIPMLVFLRNTLTITFFSVLGTCLSASLVAFGFARVRFPYRDAIFLVVLSTMMIPGQVTLIPTYILFRILKWIDTFLPLIVPAFFGGGAFNIFLMRQFYMRLPLELDDAARIDGCSSFGIYRRIVLPQSRPVLGVIAIFGFLGTWNDFFGPLIYRPSDN